MKAHWLALLLVVVPGGAAAQDACDYFLPALSAVPHETLTRDAGELQVVPDGKRYRGCEVVLVTTERLLAGKGVPEFQAEPGTDLYRAGWRGNPAYSADGPGTSLHGLERGNDLCLVSSAQPAAVEGGAADGSGVVVSSETVTITVQCRRK